MSGIDEILNKLNDEQIKPVQDTEGAVLVIAGAGSGKTRVLTGRIAYLVEKLHVSPYRILAITFTNKAANEMKERLLSYGLDVEGMWVSTIHSMCVKILRRDIDKIGYDKNFTIYDETDKDKALKHVFENLGMDTDKFLKMAREVISKAKNDCLSPEEYKIANSHFYMVEDMTRIYSAYQEYLQKNNSLDFDDLLFRTYELFVRHPEVADYYADRFEYVHIDEFQDTNTVQFAIAQRLSVTHGNIFVVGDDDQSIYGWRGAKVENILHFDRIYKGAKIYKLERNYRSTKKILELANCIIANNKGRRRKTLWTENNDGAKIETYVGENENEEASFVALTIKGLMLRQSNVGERFSYKDFAILMRVNAISRAFEHELTKYNIPYRVYGGFKFFERKEIKDVLAYLKVINNPADDESFLRAVVSPKRGIGDKTLQEIREFAASINTSVFYAIDRIEETSLGGAAAIKLKNFKNLLIELAKRAEMLSVTDLMKEVIDKTSFLDQFAEDSEENVSKKMNIDELKNSAETFEEENVGATLQDYLSSVTLSTDTDDIENDNAVTVATIHAVKGLEFKCVFVSGLDERIMPISRSFDDESDMEEERRLMYVAVTRAMERLYLTRANSRYMYGDRDFMTQSRFLKEAQEVLGLKPKNNSQYQRENRYNGYNAYDRFGRNNQTDDYFADEVKGGTGYSSAYAKSMLGGNKPKENSVFGEYKAGVKVLHKKFGEGTVIQVRGSGDNTIVDVAFRGVGIKSLSAKFAPMEIIV